MEEERGVWRGQVAPVPGGRKDALLTLELRFAPWELKQSLSRGASCVVSKGRVLVCRRSCSLGLVQFLARLPLPISERLSKIHSALRLLFGASPQPCTGEDCGKEPSPTV